MDAIAREQLGPLYEGVIPGGQAGLDDHADAFMRKYDDHIFKGPAFDLGPVTGADLFYVCTHGNYTAGSLEGWSPRDFSIFPLYAFVVLAQLLNGIENGMRWPSGCLHAKSAFLVKDASKTPETISDFRVLLILSCLS